MDEREELKMKLEQKLKWTKYRQKMLDIIGEKLIKMKEIAEQARQGTYTAKELGILNGIINNLATQVRTIDEESRKTEYGIMDE